MHLFIKTPIDFLTILIIIRISNKKESYKPVKNLAITGSIFQNIFHKYYEWLCNYVVKLSGDPALADDIVQEVFIRFWEMREEIEIHSSVKYYLLKTCHNQFLQHIRKNKREVSLLEEIKWETLRDLQVENKEDQSKNVRLLQAGLEELSPRCKEAFLLSKYNKLKYKEIAEEMGISVKTVEIHISKALSILRKSISLFL
ncbi:RNA polymerase sigma factor [Gillisia sp. Q332]|uniref:RNA polymerase sigma factor n=1 Tax=Gillisia xinjiangensis TaxID=3384765 RepID=UPI00391B77FD